MTISSLPNAPFALWLDGIQVEMNDDAPALQHRIDALSKTGGMVNLDRGVYNLSKPLLLPRTGPFPGGKSVQIAGAGQFATEIKGLPTFPAGRGLIEWASPTGGVNDAQAWGQRISSLTLTLSNVAGVRAIRYMPATPFTTAEQAQNEWLQLFLENISINAHNNYHDVLIDVSNCRFATWNNICADPDYGDGKGYDTLLIRTPSHGVGGILADDSLGLVLMHVSGLTANRMRGGSCRTFEGRAYMSTIEDSHDVGGHYAPSIGGVTAPNTTTPVAFHLTDSVLVTLRHLAAEPKGSAFLRIDNGTNIQVEQSSCGTPPQFGMIAQDSIALYGCRNVKLKGRFSDPGIACYSQFGVASLRMDAACVDCVAEDFDVTVTAGPDANPLAAKEILIDSKAKGCRASGIALQAWSPNVDVIGKVIPFMQPYTVGNK